MDLTARVNHVTVRDNTGSLESLRGDLLALTADDVQAVRVLLRILLTLTDVVNAELRIRDTAAEAGLRVGLILAVPIALSWPATHGKSDFRAEA